MNAAANQVRIPDREASGSEIRRETSLGFWIMFSYGRDRHSELSCRSQTSKPKALDEILSGGLYEMSLISRSHREPKMQKLPKEGRFIRKLLVVLVLGLVASYLSLLTFVWWAMLQPPETFGRMMAKMPGPVVFLLLPFETLWTHARGGILKVGDSAPDFSLLKVDKSESIQLSTLNKQQPVVLIFGSYT